MRYFILLFALCFSCHLLGTLETKCQSLAKSQDMEVIGVSMDGDIALCTLTRQKEIFCALCDPRYPTCYGPDPKSNGNCSDYAP